MAVGFFGGNNTSGEIEVATACNHHSGRYDFESETLVAFSAKDHGADAMEDCSPTLRAGGHTRSHANAGVMPAVAIPILEAGARTGKSTSDPRAGMGVGESGDPMFTLQSGKQHAVAFAENQRGEIRTSDISPQLSCAGGKPGSGYPAVAVRTAQTSANGIGVAEEVTYTLDQAQGQAVCAAFKPGQSADARSLGYEPGLRPSLEGGGGGNNKPALHVGMAVRRLTPREAERLQGFPDGFTAIPYKGKIAADGNRYKALGNSMAVPVLKWLGQRIQQIEALTETR